MKYFLKHSLNIHSDFVEDSSTIIIDSALLTDSFALDGNKTENVVMKKLLNLTIDTN